jgi:hypothetical protein
MLIVIFYLAGLVVACAMALLTNQPQTTSSIAGVMLQYFLPIGVGLPLLISGLGHVFQSDLAAKRLGWPTGNPFQKELGFWDFAAGVIAILSFWQHGPFWLATIIVNVLFWVLAGGLHAWELLRHKNIRADNAITAIVDFLVPITLVILYALSA